MLLCLNSELSKRLQTRGHEDTVGEGDSPSSARTSEGGLAGINPRDKGFMASLM